MDKNYETVHLIGTFDHYENKEGYDDYWKTTTYQPQIVFQTATVKETGEMVGPVVVNLTWKFQALGILPKGSKVKFTARQYPDGGYAYPMNPQLMLDFPEFPKGHVELVKYINKLNNPEPEETAD
ncbi:hypothetical protein HCY80_08075 [Limosilactobacillus fermentum]